MKHEILRLENVHKTNIEFGSSISINCHLFKGEVLGVWMQNQKNCKCLVEILKGIQKQDSGTIYINDNVCEDLNVTTAPKYGIACIHSKPTLVETQSIAENLFITEGMFYPKGIYKAKSMQIFATEWLNKIKLKINPSTLVKDLSIAHAHAVEILKAIIKGANIILLDNILKFYSDKQREVFMPIFKKTILLKNNQNAFIFLTDSYSDLWKIADRGIIIRCGQNVAVLPKASISYEELLKYAATYLPDITHASGIKEKEVLTIKNYSFSNTQVLKQLTLHYGETTGLWDCNQIFRDVDIPFFRKHIPQQPNFKLDGKQLNKRHIKKAIGKDIVILNCHNVSSSIVENLTLIQNVVISMNKPVFGIWGLENKRISEYITKNIFYSLEAENIYDKYKNVAKLNMLTHSQKFVISLARFVVMKPKVIFVIDPQICFDSFQYGRFASLIKKVNERQIAVAVLSSNKDILNAVSNHVMEI